MRLGAVLLLVSCFALITAKREPNKKHHAYRALNNEATTRSASQPKNSTKDKSIASAVKLSSSGQTPKNDQPVYTPPPGRRSQTRIEPGYPRQSQMFDQPDYRAQTSSNDQQGFFAQMPGPQPDYSGQMPSDFQQGYPGQMPMQPGYSGQMPMQPGYSGQMPPNFQQYPGNPGPLPMIMNPNIQPPPYFNELLNQALDLSGVGHSNYNGIVVNALTYAEESNQCIIDVQFAAYEYGLPVNCYAHINAMIPNGGMIPLIYHGSTVQCSPGEVELNPLLSGRRFDNGFEPFNQLFQ